MKKGTLVFLGILVVLAVFAAWTTDSYAYNRYIDGCNGCHGAFRSGTTSTKPGNTWPTNKHDVHRNTMLAGVCAACHTGSPNSGTTFTGSSDGNASLPGLGCLGCHGNDYGGAIGVTGAGLRKHHANKGVAECAGCHTSDPTPLPESNNPPYYGKAGVNITNALNTDGKENYTSDGLGLDNDGDLLYDQLAGPPPPTVSFEVTKPAAAESVPAGAPYAVTWTAQTGAASYKVKLSIDGGVTWSIMAKGVTDTTTPWDVPAPKKNISKAIIKVFAFDSSNVKLGAVKSGTFSIDVLTITTPSAAEVVPQNSTYNITWTANGTAALPDQVIVKYTLNNGTTWKTAQGTPGASSFSWNVPAVSKTKNKARVKVILKALGKTVAKAISGKFTVQQ